MNDELGNLVEPMVKEWTIDELDDWVRRYRLNNNLSIGLWQSVRGTLHITQEWAGGIQNSTAYPLPKRRGAGVGSGYRGLATLARSA
jgi:hypothetical protein